MPNAWGHRNKILMAHSLMLCSTNRPRSVTTFYRTLHSNLSYALGRDDKFIKMKCDTFYFVSEFDFSSSTMTKFGIDPIAQHVSFKIFWWCVWPFCYKFSCQNVTLNRFYLMKSLEHLRFFHYNFVLSFLHSISSGSSRSLLM